MFSLPYKSMKKLAFPLFFLLFSILLFLFVLLSDKKVIILTYHSISDSPGNAMCVSPADFAAQMDYLYQNGYTVIDFHDFESPYKYSKPVIITFDDGYRDNYTAAYPVLKERGFKATVFLVTAYLGQDNILTPDDMRQMGDLVSIQSHTHNHIPITELTPEEIAEDQRRVSDIISPITGKPVNILAYPGGARDTPSRTAAGQVYDYCVSTFPGISSLSDDRTDLPRLTVRGGITIEEFVSLLD